jgi:tRNA threonylcarbamoyl adenosine modification protein YeaZ
VLAIESSGALAGVAVATETGRILGESSLDTRMSPTEMLLKLAQRLLADLGLGVRDLGLIAFSEGPGSFTGLRVGMAAALGIAAGADLPLVPVPTLLALAYPWREAGSLLVPVSGLRRGHVYGAALAWETDRFDARLAAASTPVEEFLEACRGLAASHLHFLGDALDSLRQRISLALPEAGFLGSEPARAAHVAELAIKGSLPRWTRMDLEGRAPLYLREADARKPAPRNPAAQHRQLG